jgi:small nuclear ribonucleoprotein
MERRSQHMNRPNRPIDYLKNSVNKVILIKVKRNRLFRGLLAGFDEHLNLYLEGTSQIFEYQDEDGNIREEHEDLGSIVVRGDNVIFVNLANVEE